MEIKTGTSPAGKRIAVSYASGTITAEDAKVYQSQVAPGAPLHGLPLLGVMEPGTSFSSEARQIFSNLGSANITPTALVVGSAATRVMLNFIIKASAMKTGQNGSLKVFSDEREAAAWLDSQIA
jgi:hypothetical protein